MRKMSRQMSGVQAESGQEGGVHAESEQEGGVNAEGEQEGGFAKNTTRRVGRRGVGGDVGWEQHVRVAERATETSHETVF